MSTPNPLIPQGTFQAQAAKGASNVRLAVATIVAIHVVFFGGLLLQGCKRDPEANAVASQETTPRTSHYRRLGGRPVQTLWHLAHHAGYAACREGQMPSLRAPSSPLKVPRGAPIRGSCHDLRTVPFWILPF